MSSSTPRTTRQTRATTNNIHSNPSNECNTIEDFAAHLQSSSQFIELYNRSNQSRSILITHLCQILSNSTQSNTEIDRKIPIFILDCLTKQNEHLTDFLFKENLLIFFKHVFTHPDDEETVLATLRCLSQLIQHRSTILLTTLAEWLSSIFHFLVTFLSASTYAIYDHLLNELLAQIVQHFSPLSKDLVDVLCRTSSTIISTNFLQQLKAWIDHVDDLRFALFALQLWQTLAKLFTRLIMKNHTKAVQILSVLDDVFICSNNAVQSAAFTVWSSFITHFHQTDEYESQSTHNARLLRIFLNPFLSDSTSKSKSASISKCHAWLTLISFYPKNVNDVILPFLAFAFGTELSEKTSSTTAWWSECRQIGGEYLHKLMFDTTNAEYSIRIAAENFLNFIFDFIFEKFFETNSNNNNSNEEKTSWLNIWTAFLKHLNNLYHSNNPIDEKQRRTINMCLFTRIEQWWIDSRIDTRLLLKFFETFEQIGFPLAIETILRDTNVRTKTLSATQNLSQDKNSHCRTTLSDQYLHMMLEHAVRFNDDDVTIEENYLHVISYLIETLAKTSDENFSHQATSLLTKCSVELAVQPMIIPTLFWHIWSRCSTHLIQILNRSQTFELNNRSDNAKQDAAVELLLRPFDFNDISRLDYSHTTLWIQLFKALVRLALLDSDQSKTILIHLLTELLRNKPAFEQAIQDERNQRLFGLILVILKTLMKTLNEHEFSNSNVDRSNLFSISQKRCPIPSAMQLCLTQLTMILNDVLQRILTNNENNLQYLLVASCLAKSNKCSAVEQAKAMIFTYIRDLLIDLFALCKIYSHLEIILKNLTELLPFLNQFEQAANPSSSPVSQQKQTADQLLLNKILSTISSVFETTHSSALLQLSSSLFIAAFQHPKTLMRNKTRKYWNETFGRCTFLIYPNELRSCLRELKDKEHLLLPCFLADHDNSNTAGSGAAPPVSTDESQLSQQIDIVTPLIRPALPVAQRLTFSSPTRAVASPAKSFATRTSTTTTNNHDEPVFVPITNNINFNNQTNSPLTGNKRRSSAANSCLTEKQKEKLRSRQMIPLLCDDHSNTQSSICTMDAPSSDSPFGQSNNEKKTTSSALPLFSQPVFEKAAAPPASVESPAEEEHVPEESSIAKKLRRSCRPSISARKSLVNKTHKKPAIPMMEELAVITTTPMETSPNSSPSSSAENQTESIKHPIKGILKRLSPTKPRATHKRHVVFHDQVKVLVFASPSRRDLLLQQKKKSPVKEEVKSSPKVVIPRENLPLRKQPMAARRLSAMPSVDVAASPPPPPSANNLIKSRSSKLFHPKDALADWTETQSSTGSIYPNLIDCDKPLETLIPLLFDNETSSNEFRQCQLKTIGDLARCTIELIESFPLPPPKWSNLQKALEMYENQQEKTSTKILTIDNNDDLSPPIATTSEDETLRCSTDFTGQSQDKGTSCDGPLYDVDVLMASLDYENRPATDESTKTELNSPRKRCLMPINVEMKNGDEENSSSPKKANLSETTSQTLGDRLKAAAELIQIKGYLPFDDDYIELVRQLVNNPSLTHLEKIHLKKSFLNH